MTELNVGDRIRDNDKRMRDRILTVVALEHEKVVAKDSAFGTFRILRRRIFTDGKARTNGFNKVDP